MNNNTLLQHIKTHLSDKINKYDITNNELTIEVSLKNYHNVCNILVNNVNFLFEQLIDLCGVDYSTYPDNNIREQGRFAVVVHLISYRKNTRIRIRTYLDDETMPIIPTVSDIWASADWFEREAFDLFGILFEGHTDLRRILTDYGFIGHPFRKDFPMIGKVEMRYDPEQQRVIYEPVSITERVVVPKVYRS